MMIKIKLKRSLHVKIVLLLLLISFLSLIVILINKNNERQLTRAILTTAFMPEDSPFSESAQTKGIIYHGSRKNKKIALTFDACMTYGMKIQLENKTVNNWFNKDVINVLKNNHVKATIFLTGLWAETYPKEAKSLADDGFEIANHSYSHPAYSSPCFGLNALNDNEKNDDLDKSQVSIAKITGQTPLYFRFPGGCYSQRELKIVKEHGLIPVQWDIVGGDAFNQNTFGVINNLLTAKNGSIVVLHLIGGDNAPKTAEALKIALPKLRREGFEFVTVSEILN